MAASSPAATAEKANGLATYLQVIYAPKAAFEQLARTPMWGWAALAGMVLLIGATFLSMPEQIRVAQIAQQSAVANLPADQAAAARQNMQAMSGALPLFIVGGAFFGIWFIWFVSALLNFLAALVGGGNAKFGLAWVAAVNAGAVFFLVALVNSIILALRGPDSISGPLSAYTLPGLGMLANPSNMKLAMFLTFFNVGYLWGFIVVGIALVNLLKIKPVTATILTIVIALLTDALLAALAR